MSNLCFVFGHILSQATLLKTYLGWTIGLGFKGIPQTGQSRCPSRLRLSTLQGFSLVVMVKEVRVSKREATSCSKSSRRESKSWRGNPICLG